MLWLHSGIVVNVDYVLSDGVFDFRLDVFIQQYGFDVLGVMALNGGADYTIRTKKKKVVEVMNLTLYFWKWSK